MIDITLAPFDIRYHCASIKERCIALSKVSDSLNHINNNNPSEELMGAISNLNVALAIIRHNISKLEEITDNVFEHYK